MDHKYSDEESNYTFALQLSSASVLPMVLSTALELDLLELIKNLGGPPRDFVSAADVAADLPATNPAVHNTLDRILRLLASHSVLNCTLRCLPNGRVERAYSLAPVCELLTKNGDGVSMAPLSLLNQDKHSIGSWFRFKDVLEGRKGCNRPLFDLFGENPSYGNLFYRAMSEHSSIIMKKILDKYDLLLIERPRFTDLISNLVNFQETIIRNKLVFNSLLKII